MFFGFDLSCPEGIGSLSSSIICRALWYSFAFADSSNFCCNTQRFVHVFLRAVVQEPTLFAQLLALGVFLPLQPSSDAVEDQTIGLLERIAFNLGHDPKWYPARCVAMSGTSWQNQPWCLHRTKLPDRDQASREIPASLWNPCTRRARSTRSVRGQWFWSDLQCGRTAMLACTPIVVVVPLSIALAAWRM